MLEVTECDFEVEKDHSGKFRVMFTNAYPNRPIDNAIGVGPSKDEAKVDLLKRTATICGQTMALRHDNGAVTYVDWRGQY